MFRRQRVRPMQARSGWCGWRIAVLFAAVLQGTAALAAAPGFRVVELGAGSPVDVNSSGTVVGITGTTMSPQPWIVAAGVRSALPLPAGATYAMVTRVSAAGVAVGHVAGKPLVWLPGPGGYTTQPIPLPAPFTGCAPSAVNDGPTGPRVLMNCGYLGFLANPVNLYFSASTPFLYSAADGLVNLATRYALPIAVAAPDMTASGRILASTGAILEPDGTVTPAPSPRIAGYWQGWSATRLNEEGEMIAVASLATSDGHGEIARYTPGVGWFVIETFIGATYPYSADGISEAGDALSSQYGGHMLTTADGERLPLDALLLDPGYVLTTAPGGAMADDGRIVTVARNPAGTWTAVRLDPGTPVPPPTAAVLTGVAHPATSSAPWNAISLAWTAVPGATAYVVERRGPADAGFTALTPASGTIQLKYDDTSVVPLVAYTYRVIARSLAGNGPPSNEVTVQAPPPMDDTPPVARITSPAAGAVITGTVTVTAAASDNVGLRGFEIRYQPNQGSEVLCARTYATPVPSDTLACAWNPAYLPSGTTAQLIAYAYDDTGNYALAPVTVTYQRSGGDTIAPRVTVLSPANNATVSGSVTIRASATDNVGVTRMELRDASGTILASATGGALGYTWSAAGLARGTRVSFTVRAYDAAGNTGSATLTLRVGR